MSEIINYLPELDEFRTLYLESPSAAWTAVAITAPVGALIGSTIDYFRNPAENGVAYNPGFDTAQIAQDTVNEDRSGRFRNTVSRWYIPALLTGALSMGALDAQDPVMKYDKAVTGVEQITLVDASYSMTYTTDMAGDTTRLSAAEDIIRRLESDVPEETATAVIAFGDDEAEVLSALSSKRLDEATSPGSTDLSGNGADAERALELASNILSGTDNPGAEVITFITDGSVDRPEATAEVLRQFAETNEQAVVQVAITGSPEGEYTRSDFDPEPIAAPTNAKPFMGLEELDNVDVFVGDSADDLASEIIDGLDREVRVTEERPTDIFRNIGIGMVTLAAAGVLSKVIRRRLR